MKEDFLHYLWQFKKFDVLHLKTINNDTVQIVKVGEHNLNAGPDFFNAKLKIGNQEWAGNVELHLKSSDWYQHKHDKDQAYDTTILHVVWEYDADVERSNGSLIPTLELKPYVNLKLQQNYYNLFAVNKKWINCQERFGVVNDFLISNWLERVFFERLIFKSSTVSQLLQQSNSNWEWVLFYLLSKNFGLKVNGDAFASMASSLSFSLIRKVGAKQEDLESLFFGQSKLLNKGYDSEYYEKLKSNYNYLAHKFQLQNSQVVAPIFFRLRPSSFPTIRLSQLACLYHEHQNLFSKVIHLTTLKEIYDVFEIGVSEFWRTHYSFQSESKPSKRLLSKSFIDLIIINTIIPLKFCYAKSHGYDWDSQILDLANAIGSEKNSIVDGFNNLKKVSNTAIQSQALIQLKTNYCDKNKCLQCEIGSSLISN